MPLKVCVLLEGTFLEMDLYNHLRLSIIEFFYKVTTKMTDQDVKESHEKTVNLEMLCRWNKNKCFILLKKVGHWKTNCRIDILDFNVLMDIHVNGRN